MKLYVQQPLRDYYVPSTMPGPREIQMNKLWIPHTRSSCLEQEKADKQLTIPMTINTAMKLDLKGHPASQEVAEESLCWAAVRWSGPLKEGRNWGDT